METSSTHPPSTVNNMVIAPSLKGPSLTLHFSYLWLLWVHVQHTTAKKKHQILNYKEFLPGTTLSNFKKTQRLLNLQFFHLFCCGEEGGVKVRLSLFFFLAIQAQGKETPNDSISIFYKKHPFWTTGNQFSLSCSWNKRLSVLTSPPPSSSINTNLQKNPLISASSRPVCKCKWNVLRHLLPMDTSVSCCTVALPSPMFLCSFSGGGQGDPFPLPPPLSK